MWHDKPRCGFPEKPAATLQAGAAPVGIAVEKAVIRKHSKKEILMVWHVELIPEAEAELLALPPDMRARFLHIAEMLEKFGPQRVGMPHVRLLGGKVWEIRMTGRDGIAWAIYVTRTGLRVVVLHVFVKKMQKTPWRAIEMAYTRMRGELNDD